MAALHTAMATMQVQLSSMYAELHQHKLAASHAAPVPAYEDAAMARMQAELAATHEQLLQFQQPVPVPGHLGQLHKMTPQQFIGAAQQTRLQQSHVRASVVQGTNHAAGAGLANRMVVRPDDGLQPSNLFDAFSWEQQLTEFNFILQALCQGGPDGYEDRHPLYIVAALAGYNAKLTARGHHVRRFALNMVQGYGDKNLVVRDSPKCALEHKSVTKMDDAKSGLQVQGSTLVVQSGCTRTLRTPVLEPISSRAEYVEAAVTM